MCSKINSFYNYKSFFCILLTLMIQTLAETNISNSTNHVIETTITLNGVNINKTGIFINNIKIFSTEYNKSEINQKIEDNSTLEKNCKIISRGTWVARPPSDDLIDLELPIERVIIAHTATEGCTTQAQCTFRVRSIQTYHIESRMWHDIGYNFLIGGDGAVYEGRGWNKQGAHTKGYNPNSIGVAFIGTFIKIEPSEQQLNAAKCLFEEGIKLGNLQENYTLYGHRQLVATESPGQALFEIIKKWPRFSNSI